MQSEQQYIDLFQQSSGDLCSHSVPALNARREEAFAHFRELGFPSRKVEEYRYTDLQALFAPNYGLNIRRLRFPVNPADVFSCAVPNLSTALFFVVNDAFVPNPQRSQALPQGVRLCSLAEYAQENPLFVEQHYARLAPTATDAATALNTMLAQDGLVLHVEKGVVCPQTLQVVNLLRSDVNLMINRRVLIVLEDGAQAQILFCDHAMDSHRFLTTEVSEVFLGEGAQLDYYSLEETHTGSTRVSNTHVRQSAQSRFSHHSLTLHNGTTRNQLRVELAGSGAECWINGGVIADKAQHVDNNTLIDHQAPHCQSHELYKYVLDGQATGAFAGRILVRKDAQKTSSEETNQNLCTSTEARMYTQPMLEIYADDVKCSHGSTIGQLNEAALFYMQQRGISRAEAQTLLQGAFLNDVLAQIHLVPLRDRLRYLIEKRLRGELNQCAGCQLCQ